MLGYSFAQIEGLPLPSVLSALVQDPVTRQALAQGLAAAEFLAPQFSSLVGVGFVSPILPTPEEALLTWEVLGGSSSSHHMLAPIGECKHCCLAVQYSHMWWPVDARLSPAGTARLGCVTASAVRVVRVCVQQTNTHCVGPVLPGCGNVCLEPLTLNHLCLQVLCWFPALAH